MRGQLWRALLLPNTSIIQTHVDKVSAQLETHPISSTVVITVLVWISRGDSFFTSFWYAQLERAPHAVRSWPAGHSRSFPVEFTAGWLYRSVYGTFKTKSVVIQIHHWFTIASYSRLVFPRARSSHYQLSELWRMSVECLQIPFEDYLSSEVIRWFPS